MSCYELSKWPSYLLVFQNSCCIIPLLILSDNKGFRGNISELVNPVKPKTCYFQSRHLFLSNCVSNK